MYPLEDVKPIEFMLNEESVASTLGENKTILKLNIPTLRKGGLIQFKFLSTGNPNLKKNVRVSKGILIDQQKNPLLNPWYKTYYVFISALFIILIIISSVLNLLFSKKKTSNTPLKNLAQARKSRSSESPCISKITGGICIQLSAKYIINIVVGQIQDIQTDSSYTAVVLPANTAFDDECIFDTRSALGAFFQKHFPNGINQVQQIIKEKEQMLSKSYASGIHEHPPGTTIFLEKPLGSDYRILITAVTHFSPKDGIKTDAYSLAASMKSIFVKSAGLRLSKLFMPVIGTGHGGLDFKNALALILLQSIHSIMYEGTHHITELTILVHDPKGHRQKQIENVAQSIIGIL